MKVKNNSSHMITYPTISGVMGPNEEKTVTMAEGEVYISSPYVVEIQDKPALKPDKKEAKKQ